VDWGLIVTLGWAIAVTAVWGSILSDSVGLMRQYHDRRAKREVVWAFALFLVALASMVSILFFVFVREVPGLRSFAAAIALGSFLGAGIVVKTFSGPHNESRR